MSLRSWILAAIVIPGQTLCLAAGGGILARAQERGEFEGATDVGDAQPKGSVRFDPGRREYRITGGGENMWGSRDAFHFFPRPRGTPTARRDGWSARGWRPTRPTPTPSCTPTA
ncbi:MAG: hypothetical protein DMF79_15395 [Acidobacteria bacterium]|nr:MAG: hypothetical protein DMF79_15395 [Acidobacteriota bacterium]